MLVFEELAAHHDLTRFRCGNSQLDSYLKREGFLRARRREARIFVLLDAEADATRPLGFIALAATGAYVPTFDPDDASLAHESFQYTALLAFLARDVSWRGYGIGKLLLLEALRQCALAAEHIGLPGVFLEATEEGASLYEEIGFTWLNRNDKFMYLPMAKVQSLVESTE